VRIAGFRDESSRGKVLEFLSYVVSNKTIQELEQMLNDLPAVIAEGVTDQGLPMLVGGLESRGALVDVISTLIEAGPTEEEKPGAGIVAWEDRSEKNIFGAFWKTFKNSLFGGRRFYSNLSDSRAVLPPLAYAAMIWIISISLSMPVLLNRRLFGLDDDRFPVDLGPLLLRLTVIGIVLAPVYVPLVISMAAGLFHLFISLMGGEGGYERTVRVLAYASSAGIFQAIPVIGLLIMWWYMLYLVITGFAAAHRISAWRAAFCAVGPVVIISIMVSIFAALVAFFVGESMIMNRFHDMLQFN